MCLDWKFFGGERMDAPVEFGKTVGQTVNNILTTTGYGAAALCCITSFIIIGIIAYVIWRSQQRQQ